MLGPALVFFVDRRVYMLNFFEDIYKSVCSPLLLFKTGFELTFGFSLPSAGLSTLNSAFLIAAVPFLPFVTCLSICLNMIGKLPSMYW